MSLLELRVLQDRVHQELNAGKTEKNLDVKAIQVDKGQRTCEGEKRAFSELGSVSNILDILQVVL
jgi:hypothetical protein